MALNNDRKTSNKRNKNNAQVWELSMKDIIDMSRQISQNNALFAILGINYGGGFSSR